MVGASPPAPPERAAAASPATPKISQGGRLAGAEDAARLGGVLSS